MIMDYIWLVLPLALGFFRDVSKSLWSQPNMKLVELRGTDRNHVSKCLCFFGSWYP